MKLRAWQGGKSTLMGLDFFRRSIEIVERVTAETRTLSNQGWRAQSLLGSFVKKRTNSNLGWLYV